MSNILSNKHTRIRLIKIITILILISTTLAVYYRVGTYEFITFDDDLYVYAEPHVKEGLTIQNILWSIKNPHANNWHPITSISLFMNSSLFGMDPQSYHLINLTLHIANSFMLLLVLTTMTGNYWRSFFVAALFALHPLHVESVAWVSERKDVLSTFFLMLTMLSYWWYASSPRIGRYVVMISFMILGLLAKPMLVTLPFILILLDYWPLTRIRTGEFSQLKVLLLEKVPLFILSVLFSAVTFYVQNSTHMVKTTIAFPVKARIANAVISYVAYLKDMFFPIHLSIFYPFPENIPILQAVFTGFLLLSITASALWFMKKAPYFTVGWFWYLTTLVPVIGIIQVGLQARADRYTYIPLIGIFIIIAWGIPEILARFRYAERIIVPAAIMTLIMCAISTWHQVGYWKDSRTLYNHGMDVIEKNYWAHNQMAHVLLHEGHTDQAIRHYKIVLEMKPDYTTNARYNLGVAFFQSGKMEEAVRNWKIWLHDNPHDPEGHFNIAIALLKLNYMSEAISHLHTVIRLDPNYSQAEAILQETLFKISKVETEIRVLEDQLVRNPGNERLLHRLAILYSFIGKDDQSVRYLSRMLIINPDNPDTYYNLACIYSRKNDVETALNYIREAVQKGFRNFELIMKDPDMANIRHTEYVDELMKSR